MKPEDYDNYMDHLVDAVMEFNSLFSDYVKQTNPELWTRAIDYAKEYAKNNTISFSYAQEKTTDNVLSSNISQTIFVKELAEDIDHVREEYLNFIEDNSDILGGEIQAKWLEEKQTTKEDPFGYETDIELFVNCHHKFNFSCFDTEDWKAYTNIVIVSTFNPEFQNEYRSILSEWLTDKSDIYQYFIDCIENPNDA